MTIEKFAAAGILFSLSAFVYSLAVKEVMPVTLSFVAMMIFIFMPIHIEIIEDFLKKNMHSIRFIAAFIALGTGLFILVIGTGIRSLWINAVAISLCTALLWAIHRLLKKSSTAN
jgi:putative effector of murein hydrolase LrgA (UPF0299 family)